MRNTYGSGGTAKVMRFTVTHRGKDESHLPKTLVNREQLSPRQAVTERQIVFARGGASAHGITLWTVNGQAFSEDTVIARPKLGIVEKWTIRALNVEHPFHIHLAGFQVYRDDQGGGPGVYQHGWKDTVNLDMVAPCRC